jgi:hypothetical protein
MLIELLGFALENPFWKGAVVEQVSFYNLYQSIVLYADLSSY